MASPDTTAKEFNFQSKPFFETFHRYITCSRGARDLHVSPPGDVLEEKDRSSEVEGEKTLRVSCARNQPEKCYRVFRKSSATIIGFHGYTRILLAAVRRGHEYNSLMRARAIFQLNQNSCNRRSHKNPYQLQKKKKKMEKSVEERVGPADLKLFCSGEQQEQSVTFLYRVEGM